MLNQLQITLQDPEYELDPCRRLASLGATAAEQGWGVEPFVETARDSHSFARREGRRPEQKETDGDVSQCKSPRSQDSFWLFWWEVVGVRFDVGVKLLV